jgi:hypothetical protein
MGTSLDNDSGPPDYEAMEARIAKLEADLTAMKIDVAVIKLTCATKTDLAELKAELKAELAETKSELKTAISEGQTKIIIWVVSAIFIAQLLPILRDSLTSSAPIAARPPATQSR